MRNTEIITAIPIATSTYVTASLPTDDPIAAPYWQYYQSRDDMCARTFLADQTHVEKRPC